MRRHWIKADVVLVFDVEEGHTIFWFEIFGLKTREIMLAIKPPLSASFRSSIENLLKEKYIQSEDRFINNGELDGFAYYNIAQYWPFSRELSSSVL